MEVSIGLDVGGTKCLGVAVSADGRVLAEDRSATPDDGPALVDALAGAAGRLLDEVGAPAGPSLAVGVGVPGLVDADGVLQAAPNLPGAVGAAVAPGLAERLGGAFVSVDNDVTCAAAAEWLQGAGRQAASEGGRPSADLLLVALGTGIGGAYVAGGDLVLGAHGFAGEIGHMVVDPSGIPCPCGRRGCWERYASGTGLATLARGAVLAGRAPAVAARAGGDPERVRGEDVTEAAREGDAAALAVVEEFAGWLALGLANLVNVLDPELVAIGGGLAREADLLLGPTWTRLAAEVDAERLRPRTRLVAAVLGEQAGAVGAALLGRRRAVRAPGAASGKILLVEREEGPGSPL